MKRLILMRHAKSDKSDPTISDHLRPLHVRGQEDATNTGMWMRENKIIPDHVLSSDAVRTRETLERLNLGDIPTTFLNTLYLAKPDIMAATLRSCSETSILMVAHNPGCAMLAELLLASAPRQLGFITYPTCATLVAEFNITHWQELHLGTGKLSHFTTPRDIYK